MTDYHAAILLLFATVVVAVEAAGYAVRRWWRARIESGAGQ